MGRRSHATRSAGSGAAPTIRATRAVVVPARGVLGDAGRTQTAQPAHAAEAALTARPITVVRAVAVTFAVYLAALLVRLWATGGAPFPANEGSAYYVDVARNLVEGRGLVADAIWSYATPPLVLPKPAFEIWMPMASLLAAVPMALVGSTLAGAQLGTALLGAALAPLTWLIARDAATRHGLHAQRAMTVATGAALVAAVAAPFVLPAMAPDSSTPFLVFALVTCWLMPRALVADGSRRAAVALGVALGLAYLSRQEALHLGIAYLALAFGAARALPRPRRRAWAARAVALPVVAGAVTIAPWLLRNLLAFGSLWPGQTLENAWLTRNEQIFAYAERPTASGFLAQGVPTILANQAGALASNLVEVLLVHAAPVGALGIVGVIALRRSAAIRETSPLRALLLTGCVTYLATSLAFPVATRWGTFLHASGPMLAALVVVAALAGDRSVARIGRVRGWARENRWMAPLAILALVVPLTALQVTVVAAQARAAEARIRSVAAVLESRPELATAPRSGTAPSRAAAVITDHPLWLAYASDRPVIALPDEPPHAVWRLARDFSVPLIVVLDERGRYPGAFDTEAGRACFARVDLPPGETPLALFRPLATCPTA